MNKEEALAKYLGVDVEDIDNLDWDKNAFSTSEGDYLVLTQEEAEEYAKDDIENAFDDLGLDAFTESFQRWIIDWCLNDSYIEDWMRESYESYVEDIESENSMEYDNRLIEELVDNDLLSEEDFETDEDGEVDWLSLKDSVDLDDLKYQYVDSLVESQDASSWLTDMYGTGSDLAELIKDNEYLIDFDKLADECISVDGVAHFISSYDGDEHELEGDFYAYRIN